MTNFFQNITNLIGDGTTLSVNIFKSGDRVTVSLLPKVKDLNDPAAQKIQPIILNGTAQELDQGFLEAVASPLKKSSGIISNMKSYEDSVKTAEANSKALKDAEDKKKKEIESNNKKFEKNKTKFDEFIEAKDFTNAEKYLVTIKKITPISAKNTKDLVNMEEKFKELKSSQSQISLLDQIG